MMDQPLRDSAMSWVTMFFQF